MLAAGGEESSALEYHRRMNFAKGIAAILLGMAAAALFGIAAGVAIGVLILLAPFAWAYDATRRLLQRRAPKPH